MNKTLPIKDYVTRRDLTEALSTIKRSVINIETKINIYSDMYENNKWNNTKLANRVSKLEKHAGITPSEEFLISGL
jgi:hypothetical protein